jgi:hypothetical protein
VKGLVSKKVGANEKDKKRNRGKRTQMRQQDIVG